MTSTHPDWAIKHRMPGTELRRIKNRYYLYEYTTVYNLDNKKPKKISGKLLGSITETGGFKQSSKRKLEASVFSGTNVISPISVKEFGNIWLIKNKFSAFTKVLQDVFPDIWQQLLAIAYCRFVYQCPLKSIPFRLESSYFYDQWAIKKFNDKDASKILNQLGQNSEKMYEYMRHFIKQGSYLLIDGTHIVSKSELIDSVSKGYNSQRNFDGQFNLLYIYSAQQHMPVFYRFLQGNIRDVKAFKNTLGIAQIEKAVIICDKGFYSNANVQLMKDAKLDYIMPLKRDNPLIDYSTIKDNSIKDTGQFFKFKNRFIWCHKSEMEEYNVYLFLDESLRLTEERDFLNRLESHPETHSHEKYIQKRSTLGTITLIAPKSLDQPKEVYETYKSRMEIENVFDGLKNVLHADKSYMQNEQTLLGWTFINHICLQWHHCLYNELKQKDLIKKISVNDYISTLTDIKQIKINNQWHLNEFTNKTKKLLTAIGVKI